jgi:hypothetical protein
MWDRFKHVRPEWFSQWADAAIWRAVQFSYQENDGFAPEVVLRWLQEYFPDDAEALLDRLANIADDYLHAEFIDYYLATLEQSGVRLALQRWACHIDEMCRTGRAMNEIRQAVASPPIHAGGVA